MILSILLLFFIGIRFYEYREPQPPASGGQQGTALIKPAPEFAWDGRVRRLMNYGNGLGTLVGGSRSS